MGYKMEKSNDIKLLGIKRKKSEASVSEEEKNSKSSPMKLFQNRSTGKKQQGLFGNLSNSDDSENDNESEEENSQEGEKKQILPSQIKEIKTLSPIPLYSQEVQFFQI